MVALHTVSTDALDSSIPDEDLVIALAPDASIDRVGADAVVEFAATDPADAWFGDLDVAGMITCRAAWSPTRLLSEPGAAWPLAVRAGWLRAHSTTAAAPDLARQLARAEADVAHVTAVLTHHRVAPVAAEAGDGIDGLDGFSPDITLVIPTAGARLDDGERAVTRLLDRLEERPDRIDIVIVVGEEYDGDPDSLAGRGRTVVRRPPGSFNFSTAVNRGVLESRADIVVLLNDDTEPGDHGFVDRMARHLADPSVAAVGALLTYADGTVQHAGIVIDDARPLHPFVGWDPSATSVHGGLFARDVVAVTGACLMVRRADFLAVGGLSPSFPLSFNDVDLCVRLRRAVGRVVIEPAARLIHHETLTRQPVIAADEWDRWIRRWGEIEDPWYHPAYDRPDDPHDLARNADHLAPRAGTAVPITVRRPRLRSVVHRGRPATTNR